MLKHTIGRGVFIQQTVTYNLLILVIIVQCERNSLGFDDDTSSLHFAVAGLFSSSPVVVTPSTPLHTTAI